MTEVTTPKATTPPSTTARLPLLDVLRGTAILGTLMTNVWIFTTPGSEWGILTGDTAELSFSSFPQAVEGTLRWLANGRFLALLTILFGVGLAIQYASATRRGEPWPGRYRRRALFLFAEGTVHFLLVFAWDVLMGYAVTALLVAWLLTRSAKVRNRVMWWTAGLHLLLMGVLTIALVAEGNAGDQSVSPEVVDLYAHGSYWEQIVFRWEHALMLRLEPILTFCLLVVLFLVGVRLFRAGAFGADATGRHIRSRLLFWGLGLGVPLSLALALLGDDFFLLDRYVAAPLVALGYLGLIGVLMDRVRRPGPVLHGLTCVGRTALSGYVLQNVLCMVLAYGIGLGLTHRMGEGWRPWWVIGLWAVVCVILLVGSTLWLRRFPMGPLESLQKRALRR